ncbi:MAG: flagellar assembly peptidoglycan hydrolase FlgJ [Panacagrimonas sp.]
MAAASPTPIATDFSGFTALKTSARANDPETVRKAAQQFEALFVQQMLKSARAASLGDDMLGGGQTEFYQDMFDQQMSLHLANGKGMGLADVLVKQLLPTASAQMPDFDAAQAPLPGLGTTTGTGAPLPSAVAPSATGVAVIKPDAQSLVMPELLSMDQLSALPSTAVIRDVQAIAQGRYQSPDNAAHFIAQIRPHAERVASTLGVPAEAVMAQAALETGWGRHVPTHADGRPGHNFFGIKAHGGWDGARLDKTTHEHLGGRMQRITATFRAYDSIGEGFDDYARFLKTNPRYAEALRQGTDAQGFAQGLQEAGYATDPAYASKLLKMMRSEPISREGDSRNPERPV